MEKGYIQIFCGEGHGKSPAAAGKALQAACRGERAVIIQFLKGKGVSESDLIKRLEPELKIFRFEKSLEEFDNLSEQQKKEEILNIRNGLNFARKVMNTAECDLLVLDEVIGLVDMNIISQEELAEMIGVCRSTISNIENKRQPLQWSLFLSLLMIFTNNTETNKLLVPMEIYTEELDCYIGQKNK